MKNMTGHAVALIMAVCATEASLEASPLARPPTSGVWMSIDTNIDLTTWRSKPERPRPLVTGSDVQIATIHVKLPALGSKDFGTAQDKLIADWLSGSLSTNLVMTSPGQYVLCNGRIDMGNLIYSLNNDLWDGSKTIPAGFEGERGLVDAQLVVVSSRSGQNAVSLSMLSTTQKSNEDGNALGDTIGYIGNYTSRAPLVMADGTVHRDGPTSDLGVKAAVIVMMKKFNGGDTQEGIDQVFQWVGNYPGYSLTVTTQVIGDNTTASPATVSVNGINIPDPGNLKIVSDGSQVMVIITNAVPNAVYRIERKADLNVGTVWRLWYIQNGTNSYVGPLSGQEYFRAEVQH